MLLLEPTPRQLNKNLVDRYFIQGVGSKYLSETKLLAKVCWKILIRTCQEKLVGNNSLAKTG